MHTPSDSGTRGLTLLEKVQIRRNELELALAAEDGPDRADIESALAMIGPMLTGDLDKLPDMVSRELVRWLEANKYVGVKAEVRARPAAQPAKREVGPAAPTAKAEVGRAHSVETYDADKTMAEPTGAVPIHPQT